MEHRATLTYTESVVALAVRCFWRRAMGLGVVIATLALIALLAWRLILGDHSWLVGVLAASAALSVALPIAVFCVHYQISMRKLREMGSPTAEFIAGPEQFSLSSGAGTTTLKWSAITEVWCYKTLWLVLFSRSQFATLPLEGISEPMRAFVLERIRAAGGRIAV